MDKTLPTSEFTTGELKTGIFIARHRELIKKISLGIFIGFDALLVAVALITLGFYIAGSKQHQSVMSQVAQPLFDWPTLRPLIMARPLAIIEVESVNSGGKTDFLAKVKNVNNHRWASQMNYRFVWADNATPWYKSFILPSEEKFLLGFSDAMAGSDNIRIEVDNIIWKNLSAEDRDYLSALQGSIIISDVQTRNADEFLNDANLAAVIFKVQNNSPFTYRDVSFQVIVKSGAIYRAVNYLTIPILPPTTIRDVEVRWSGNNILGGEVTVELDFNYLSENSFSA